MSHALLEESNQRLSAFAHMVAHELKAPMSVMMGYCRLLEEGGLAEKETAQAQLQRVLRGARRMHRTIESLLAMTVHQSAPINEWVDLNDSVATALENLRPRIEEAGVTVAVDSLPSLMGNGSLLTQLVQNLIGNAIKFRNVNEPRIQVSGYRLGSRVRISVADNGIGIAKAHHERIFEYFRRLHTVDQYDGTGLGLTICRQIVESHGGRIWVESELGRGPLLLWNSRRCTRRAMGDCAQSPGIVDSPP